MNNVLCRGLVFLGLAAVAFAQPTPNSAEVGRILDAIREAARAYDQKLPNFFCTQVTTRESAKAQMDVGLRRVIAPPGLDGGFRRVDTFEQQLTYFERHETYKLVKVNGRAPDRSQKVAPGATSTGEFGTTLRNIFDLESRAEFQWNRWDTLRGRPVAVFRFKIDRSFSKYELATPVARAFVAYRGLVFADRGTNTVMRVTTEAESPPDFPFQGAKHTLDYGIFSISGERFVLPMRDQLEVQASQDFIQYGRLGGSSPQILMRNRTEFRNYRRYTADAELKTEPDPN